jgi:hypothetical protein
MISLGIVLKFPSPKSIFSSSNSTRKIQQEFKRQTEKLILIEKRIDSIHLNISQFEMVKKEYIVTNIK